MLSRVTRHESVTARPTFAIHHPRVNKRTPGKHKSAAPMWQPRAYIGTVDFARSMRKATRRTSSSCHISGYCDVSLMGTVHTLKFLKALGIGPGIQGPKKSPKSGQVLSTRTLLHYWRLNNNLKMPKKN